MIGAELVDRHACMTSSAGTYMDLKVLIVLLIRQDIRGSTTLMQFRGIGYKLVLTAA
jgi:hypothetical protein